ncbi:hypothetical protein [Tunturiibacter gelidoferens]|jgi:hypothetical protein|uniref:Uncharacterized protein n=1 Tax=Tunturiibacter gelidiferens TaxID=3069689 RepID=A0A9X0QI87_9BACT|nr:hypothetical protein [Edaphobacter lichenicola]MBB5330933.1 hypothetical protein [Edaphobacter lichenicola]
MPDERVEIAGERVDAVIRRRDVGAVEAALVLGNAFKALGDNCGNLKLPDAGADVAALDKENGLARAPGGVEEACTILCVNVRHDSPFAMHIFT